MMSKCLAVLMAAVASVLAKTPAGFTPASETDLIVDYEGGTALNGAVVSQSITTSQPRLATLTPLNGTSYAVLMLDLDIPTNTPPKTNTLLHWLQTGLTPSTTATQLTVNTSTTTTTTGKTNHKTTTTSSSSTKTTRVFLLQNSTNTPALASYISPNPPARIPLSHRYVQILIDTSELATAADGGAAAMQVLTQAAATRSGFDVVAVLEKAGLAGRVVAGNSFNVTNPGPVAAAAAGGSGSGSGGSKNGTTTGGRGTGSGSGSGSGAARGTGTGVVTPGATQGFVSGGGAQVRMSGWVMVGGLALVGVLFAGF